MIGLSRIVSLGYRRQNGCMASPMPDRHGGLPPRCSRWDAIQRSRARCLVRSRRYPDCSCRGRPSPAARSGRSQRSHDEPDLQGIYRNAVRRLSRHQRAAGPRADLMRATAMRPRKSLAKRFARQVARACSTTACDADRRQRRRATPAQHYGHRTDRSFRDYGPGNITHDRRTKTGTLIERLLKLSALE